MPADKGVGIRGSGNGVGSRELGGADAGALEFGRTMRGSWTRRGVSVRRSDGDRRNEERRRALRLCDAALYSPFPIPCAPSPIPLLHLPPPGKPPLTCLL